MVADSLPEPKWSGDPTYISLVLRQAHGPRSVVLIEVRLGRPPSSRGRHESSSRPCPSGSNRQPRCRSDNLEYGGREGENPMQHCRSPARSTSREAGRGLTRVAAISAPNRRSPASTYRPICKPWARALDAGTSGCVSTYELVDAAATALITARPMAPPIWRLVLTRPDATPESEGRTPVRLPIVAETNETPRPRPPTRRPGKRSQK